MARRFLTPIDLSNNEILNVIIQNVAGTASVTQEGKIAYDTTANTMVYRDDAGVQTFATVADIAASGGGDMLEADYDSNGDGIVDRADVADEVALADVTGISTYARTLLDDANAGAARDTLALGTVATLSEIANSNLADMATARIKGRVTAGSGAPEDLTAVQVKTFLNLASTDISNFDTATVAAMLAHFDANDGGDSDYNTWIELVTQIKANATDIEAQVKRFSANVGDASATSFVLTHSMNSRNIIVQVYDTATYEDVIADVERTTLNTITVTFATAPSGGAFRVVVQG